MPVFNNILAGSSGQSTGYDIDQSLRLNDGDSPRLKRSSATVDSTTWTLSFWVKPGAIPQADGNNAIFDLNVSGQEKSIRIGLGNASNNELRIFWKATPSGGSTGFINGEMRDPSSWYHIVVAWDTTQSTESDRVTVYRNGVEPEFRSFQAYPSLSQNIAPSADDITISGYSWLTAWYSPFDGYIAEMHFVEGQRLSASDFGETDAATNQWKPIEYTGSYGTNGFYQSYSSTELAASFEDSAGVYFTEFTSAGSHTWTCPAGVTEVEVLTVAGGGAGGDYYYAGGGGGGGIVHDSTYAVTAGVVYDITVGAGGSVSYSAGARGGSGSDSVFNVNAEGGGLALTATGGGGGGSYGAAPIRDGIGGGSGGGAGPQGGDGTGGSSTQASFSGATSYGNDGGSAGGDESAGSGGGGAGEAGNVDGAPGSGAGGYGGDGVLFSTFASYGVSGYFGGGGGGGGGNGPSVSGPGGTGGGGNGAAYNSSVSVAGTANSGGGGGGGSNHIGSPNTKYGAAGGSGVVLIYHSQAGIAPRHTITANGDVSNTRAQSKVGDSSIKFDGTGDYLSVPSSSDFNFGANNFTVEGWIYNSDFSTNSGLFASGGGRSWMLFFNDATTKKLRVYLTDTSGSWNLQNGIETNKTDWAADTWYHIAMVRNGTTVKVYVDGVEDYSYTISTTALCDGDGVYIGKNESSGTVYLDGYADEIRISDSARYTTAFTPSTTAFTADANTKLLIHSDFNGGLGADSSGNKNDFTPTNLVATDQMLDSPTNNFATLNPLQSSAGGFNYALSEGNLKNSVTTGGLAWPSTFMAPPLDQKWYWECYLISGNPAKGPALILNMDWTTGYENHRAYQWRWEGSNGITYNTLNSATYTVADSTLITNGDIAAIFVDGADIKFYKNGSLTYTATGAITSGNSNVMIPASNGSDGTYYVMNFGQDSSFAGNKTSGSASASDANGIGDFYYTPPTGALACCTSNLSAPEIALPTDHFNTVLWSGDSSYPRSITGTGFSTDLLWFKSRNQAYDNILLDSVRGLGAGNDKAIVSNANSAEGIDSGNFNVSSFDSDGFTMASPSSTDTQNATGDTYVGWNWKAGGTAVSNTDGTITSSVSANTTAGFSIIKYSGDSSTSTIGHGLSQGPEIIFVKSLTNTHNWSTGATPMGWTERLEGLNTASAAATNDAWNNTAPSGSVIYLTSDGSSNETGNDYICYAFHSVEGYSKVGSYVGNGVADGTFIYTGMKPAFLLVKNIPTAARQWFIFDSARDTYNTVVKKLYTNLNNAEADADAYDFVSNGFKVKSSDANWNTSGESYLYLAFAESPFKTSNAR